jgi:hypothetical protein
VGVLALLGLGHVGHQALRVLGDHRGGFRDALIFVIGMFVAGMIFKVTGEAGELHGSKEKPPRKFGDFGRDSRDDYSDPGN